MLDSIVNGCHGLSVLPGSMAEAGAQIGFVSTLTVANLATLAKSVRPRRGMKSVEPMSVDPWVVWQAGNASIALWLLCVVIIRMGTL
jgi:hypothetical protein